MGGRFIIRGFFAAIFQLPHPVKQIVKVKAGGAVHRMHKFLFLLLPSGDRLFPDRHLALFNFSCLTLANGVCFGMGVFSLGV